MSTRKRYLVNLVEWGSYVRWIEADSAEHAIELAEQEFSEHGDSGFTLKDGCVDCDVWKDANIRRDDSG